MEKKSFLEAARVTGTHGVRGMVRLDSMMDSPEILARLKVLYRRSGGQYTPLHMERASVYKGALLAAFKEIEDLDGAIALKGQLLYAAREDIPLEEGSHFIADMIGLTVTDENLGVVGVLSEVISPAGRQVYVIEKPDGGTFMIPAVPEFILDIVTEGEAAGITVHLIDGMMS